jgi:dihydrofolate synthase/folylpolyglutamate synthase
MVSAPQPEVCQGIIARRCREKGTRIIEVGGSLSWQEIESGRGGQTFKVKGYARDYPWLKTHFLGEHQITNAVTALAVAEILDNFYRLSISEGAIRRGIANAYWPGRLEILNNDPLVVVDGAHNRESSRFLKKAMKKYFANRDVTLILAVLKDKDIAGIVSELETVSDKIILTRVRDNPRAAIPRDLISFFKDKTKIIRCCSSFSEALSVAGAVAGQKSLVLITGSLLLVGEAIQALKLRSKPSCIQIN